MVSTVSKSSPLVRVSDPHYRENKTQEVDAYIAKGKIPVEADVSQHPEKSIEARACMSLTLFTAVGHIIHFACRAYGEGRRIHQRCQDRPGNVSRIISHHFLVAQTRENSVDELVNTAAKQLSAANSFVISKAKL